MIKRLSVIGILILLKMAHRFKIILTKIRIVFGENCQANIKMQMVNSPVF